MGRGFVEDINHLEKPRLGAVTCPPMLGSPPRELPPVMPAGSLHAVWRPPRTMTLADPFVPTRGGFKGRISSPPLRPPSRWIPQQKHFVPSHEQEERMRRTQEIKMANTQKLYTLEWSIPTARDLQEFSQRLGSTNQLHMMQGTYPQPVTRDRRRRAGAPGTPLSPGQDLPTNFKWESKPSQWVLDRQGGTASVIGYARTRLDNPESIQCAKDYERIPYSENMRVAINPGLWNRGR